MNQFKQNDDSQINIPGFGPLLFVDKTPRNFFRRTTMLYGPSETGKTVIITWIMQLLQPYIPNVIVICPTDGANAGYKGKVPDRCIYTEISIQLLKDIYDRQLKATDIYNKANDLVVLKSLFAKVNDMNANTMVNRIEAMTRNSIAEINRMNGLDYAQKKLQKKAAEKNLITVTRRIYKRTIKSYRSTLAKRRDLTDAERYALKYLDFNPSLLLIMDDCGAQIIEWGKEVTINKMFFQGRHIWMSTLISMQADTGLGPSIRSNTFNNFFTDPNIASRFFQNKENAFNADIKKQAAKIISEIFKESGNSDIENYKKFCYSRLDKKAKFRYVIAEEPENLRMGSPSLWALCGKLPVDSAVHADSKFNRSFTM